VKAFTITDNSVKEGIGVPMTPYPRIVIGEGGHKRATWIALGKRDVDSITISLEGAGENYRQVLDVGVLKLADKDQYLIVAPRGNDDRVLVLWRVSSGYRGSASIEAGDDIVVVGYDHAWASGRGNLGETAEMLAVLKPEQSLNACLSGRRVQANQAKLTWTGQHFEIIFFDSTAAPVDDVAGEMI
jgi:hypothetical protein